MDVKLFYIHYPKLFIIYEILKLKSEHRRSHCPHEAMLFKDTDPFSRILRYIDINDINKYYLFSFNI